MGCYEASNGRKGPFGGQKCSFFGPKSIFFEAASNLFDTNMAEHKKDNFFVLTALTAGLGAAGGAEKQHF